MRRLLSTSQVAKSCMRGRSERIIRRVLNRALKLAVTIGVGGVLGTLFGGVGARIVMSLLADPTIVGLQTSSGATVGELTFDGTLAVLGGGLSLGIVGAVVYAALRPWLPRRGLGTAVYAALVTCAGIAITVAGNREDFAFVNPALALPLFGMLLLAYGFGLPTAMGRVRPTTSHSSTAANVVLAVLVGAVMIVAVEQVVDAFELYNESPLGGGGA